MMLRVNRFIVACVLPWLVACRHHEDPNRPHPGGASEAPGSELPDWARPGADPDGDGVRGISDQCPDNPEDCDGKSDADGCPEYEIAYRTGVELCSPTANPKCLFDDDVCTNVPRWRAEELPDGAPGLCFHREEPCECKDTAPFGCATPPPPSDDFAKLPCEVRPEDVCLRIFPKWFNPSEVPKSLREALQSRGVETEAIGGLLETRSPVNVKTLAEPSPAAFDIRNRECEIDATALRVAPDLTHLVAAYGPCVDRPVLHPQ